jgi:hypothetical protein
MVSTLSRVGITADFDVLGLARVRLIDADERDLASLGRQLGLPPVPVAGPADVIVRYVDHLDLRGTRHIGLREAAASGSDFVLLRGRHKSPVRVVLPFDQIGEQPELRCEHGTGAIPLLVAVLNLTILGKGALPLHGSAFHFRDTGALVTGWSKGGKTETLLAFMANGARYVGDEWVYVTQGHVGGLPEPVRVWDWHMRDRPELRRAVPGARLARVRAVAGLHRLGDRLAADGRPWPGHKVARRFRVLTERLAGVDIEPEALFGTPPVLGMVPFTKLLFVESVERPGVRVEPMPGAEVAARMAASLAYERRPLLAAYNEFRFAFPDRSSRLLEEAPAIEAERLAEMLGTAEAYRVSHPYPVPLTELFDAVRPLFD